jgi:hypothetical protein
MTDKATSEFLFLQVSVDSACSIISDSFRGWFPHKQHVIHQQKPHSCQVVARMLSSVYDDALSVRIFSLRTDLISLTIVPSMHM